MAAVKHTPEVSPEAKVQMARLPKTTQEQVARTLAMLLVNPYLTGTELVGTTRRNEIRRTLAGSMTVMEYEFPIKRHGNDRTPPVLRVISLSLNDV